MGTSKATRPGVPHSPCHTFVMQEVQGTGHVLDHHAGLQLVKVAPSVDVVQDRSCAGQGELVTSTGQPAPGTASLHQGCLGLPWAQNWAVTTGTGRHSPSPCVKAGVHRWYFLVVRCDPRVLPTSTYRHASSQTPGRNGPPLQRTQSAPGHS